MDYEDDYDNYLYYSDEDDIIEHDLIIHNEDIEIQDENENFDLEFAIHDENENFEEEFEIHNHDDDIEINEDDPILEIHDENENFDEEYEIHSHDLIEEMNGEEALNSSSELFSGDDYLNTTHMYMRNNILTSEDSSEDEEDFNQEFVLLGDDPLAKHSYLGVEFNEVRYTNYHRPQTLVNLVNLYSKNIFCVPGQRVLMHISLLKRDIVLEEIKNKRSFILSNNFSKTNMAAIVVDPQYVATFNQDLLIILIGRQRGRIKKIYSSRIIAEILPEVITSRSPFGLNVIPKSLNKYVKTPKLINDSPPTMPKMNNLLNANLSSWNSQNIESLSRLPTRADLYCNIGNLMTSTPGWVYVLSDVDHLMCRVRHALSVFESINSSQTYVPRLANAYSYWLIHVLPFSMKVKTILLSLDTVMERLTTILSMMKTCHDILCLKCETKIGNSSEIFIFSNDGDSTFINPYGITFDLITVKKAIRSHIDVNGSPDANFSWFPGFAWRIVCCKRCHIHLGWKFNRVDKETKIPSFYAFKKINVKQCRRSVLTDLFQSLDLSDDETSD